MSTQWHHKAQDRTHIWLTCCCTTMGQEREGLPSTGGEGRKKQYKERKNHINTNVELDIAAESNQKRKKKKKSTGGKVAQRRATLANDGTRKKQSMQSRKPPTKEP